MTALAFAPDAIDSEDTRTSELLAAITPEFAATVRWDVDRRVIVFPQDHPMLGWTTCRVPSCDKPSSSRAGICHGCYRRWDEQGRPSVEVFSALPKPPGRGYGVVALCTVPRCQRPWKSRASELCLAHHVQRRNLRIDLETFRTHPDVVPHASTGPCHVAACTRTRAGRGPYCGAHYVRWNAARRDNPNLDEAWWRRTTSAIAEDNWVSLRGLGLRVAAEIVYGLQQRCQEGPELPKTSDSCRGQAAEVVGVLPNALMGS